MPYIDGTAPSGSKIITINSVTYKCESFTHDRPAETIQRFDENGDPSGAVQFKNHQTGTAVLQFAANTTAEPTTAAENSTTGTFATTLNNVSTNCFITSVAIQKPARGMWTATIGWQAKIN